MNATKPTRAATFLILATGVALAFGTSASAQPLDPAAQTGQPAFKDQPASMEGQSDPTGEEQDHPIGDVHGVEIESDPNAPAEADAIMDSDGDNTGMPPLDD